MARVTLTLTNDERDALVRLAFDQRRDPRHQAALELRRILEHAGYLPAQTPPIQRRAAAATRKTHEVHA